MRNTRKPKNTALERLCDKWHINDDVYMLIAECNSAARKLKIQKGRVFGIFLNELQVVCSSVTKHVPLDSCYHSLHELRESYIGSLDSVIAEFEARDKNKKPESENE